MRSRVLSMLLLLGVILAGLSLARSGSRVRLLGNDEGYQPVQPIAYSHRLHAGDLAVACLYCHSGAEKSRKAGIPAVSVCMNCHRYVTATMGAIHEEEKQATKEGRPVRQIVSPEIEKLYAAMGLDSQGKPVPGEKPAPVTWKRVHSLPDFVAFDHRPHVAAGIICQSCHGPVETMERVRQVASLTMGWCVNCHRDKTGRTEAGVPVNPPLDCVTCHY